MREAVEAMGDAINQVAGEQILLEQTTTTATGSTTCSQYMVAVRGKSAIEVDGQDGARIQILSTDFIVNVRDLPEAYGDGALPGGRLVPQKGATITVNLGGRAAEVYTVMTPSWSPSDHQGLRIRIHTNRTC